MTMPTLQQAMKNAVRHHEEGRLAEAEVWYRQALAIDPKNPEALHRLGYLAHQVGQHAAAVELMSLVLRDNPCHAGLHGDLGMVFLAMGRYREAAACYHKVLALEPGHAAHNNLGLALYSMGDPEAAATHYRKALALKPDLANAWNNLGLAYINLARLAEAYSALQRALSLKPDYAEAHNNLGIACFELGQAEEAVARYRQAISIKPDYHEAFNNLGNVLLNCLSRPGEALNCYRQALTLRPDYALACDNMLLASNYLADWTAEAVHALHRSHGEQFEAAHRNSWSQHDNDRDGERRLKVGYVSADFRLHPVAFFMEPILAHHDKRQVEVHCYYNQSVHDDVTERLTHHADYWTACGGMTDAELAERMRADRIDILVDLAGRTAGNRLGVFARKPAPVQVTYLGYVATTGLSAVDYRLSHIDADPPVNDACNSERLYRMPRSLWCWRPPEGMPDVRSETPAQANGYITFGSLNNIAKISDDAVAVWSRLLRAVPSARLLLAGVPEGLPQKVTRERFGAHGIEAERLVLHHKLLGHEFRTLMHRIDIALDPFPHNGNTTTCETLWMGVPVVTLTGRGFVSRFGYHLLKTVGLLELAARNEDEYVGIALGLARDLPRLSALRASMRDRIKASPLRDEAGMARDLEAAMRSMWRTWCRTQSRAA